MTIDEVSRQYQIPSQILREYECWGLRGTAGKVIGDWQYDDGDLERLSLILTLHDVGFTVGEVETYMRLSLASGDTDTVRLRMLDRRRDAALDEIHSCEKKLARLDYLRHQLQKNRAQGPVQM